MRLTEDEWQAYQEAEAEEMEAVLDWVYPRDVDYLRDSEEE